MKRGRSHSAEMVQASIGNLFLCEDKGCMYTNVGLQRHFLPLVRSVAWGYKKGTAGLATKSHKKSPVLRERVQNLTSFARMNLNKHPGFFEHPAMETQPN